MFPAQSPERTSSDFSRCEARSQLAKYGTSLTPDQKADAALKGTVERALWHDDVLRAIDSDAIEVYVKDRVIHLNGHLASSASPKRIQKVIGMIPGLLRIHNNLILDDRLIREVAGSLAALERTYGCKFFTGASHGIISLNGEVPDQDVKLLAEKCVASHPDVRGVVNHVHVRGAAGEAQAQPFLQPAIGAIMYFLDGISGVVSQVIINPDNRRVVAMILRGEFAGPPHDLKATDGAPARSPERLVTVPVELVRHMTSVSGFLHIHSKETQRYMEFDLAQVSRPTKGWKAPHPYCPADVLFPVEKRKVEYQTLRQVPRSPFVVAWVDQGPRKELLADDSLGE